MSDEDRPAATGRPKFVALAKNQEETYKKGDAFREASARDALRLAKILPKFERISVESPNSLLGVLPDLNFVEQVEFVYFPLSPRRWFKVIKKNNPEWTIRIKPYIEKQYSKLLDALAIVYLDDVRKYLISNYHVPKARSDVTDLRSGFNIKADDAAKQLLIKNFIKDRDIWGNIPTITDMFKTIADGQGLLTTDQLDPENDSHQENVFFSKFESLKGIFEEETQDYLDKFEAIEGFTQPADIIAYEYSGMGLDPENTETESNKRKSRNIDEEIQKSTEKFFKESNFENDTLDRAYLRINQLFVRTDEPAKTKAYTPLGLKFVDALKSRRAMDEDSESSREEEKELES
jgi:hypothetical protein